MSENLENLEIVRQNIRYYRKKSGYTQESLAALIGIKRSLLAAYEEGRAAPRSSYLAQMAKIYGINEQDFGRVASQTTLLNPIKPVQIIKKPIEKADLDLEMSLPKILDFQPESPVYNNVYNKELDFFPNQQIEIVRLTESRAYLQKHRLSNYLEGLPRMSLPILAPGMSYRGFEIGAVSLKNMALGQFVVGKFVRNWYGFDTQKAYIMVCEPIGIVCGQIENRLQENGSVYFKNMQLETELEAEKILEVWEVCLIIGLPTHIPTVSLTHLSDISDSLNREIKRLSREI